METSAFRKVCANYQKDAHMPHVSIIDDGVEPPTATPIPIEVVRLLVFLRTEPVNLKSISKSQTTMIHNLNFVFPMITVEMADTDEF
ncbi:hypothetical protein Trydic_g3230 [Trypoxylus dichotomus]